MRRSSPSASFCECGDHAFANLTKGYVALVSPDDAPVLLERLWRVHVGKNYITVLSSNGGEFVLGRRVIKPAAGLMVDHRNGDTADCRRSNLRVCTNSQNQANRKAFTKGRDLPKGVRRKRNGRFWAGITFENRHLYIGTFDSVDDAAIAYQAKARELFGEFARAS